VQGGRQPQIPFAGLGGAHCLNRVFDQVQDDLLYLRMRGMIFRKIIYTQLRQLFPQLVDRPEPNPVPREQHR